MLNKIITGKTPKPRRLLLYGTHGVGKSTFCANAPSPIFVQTEDGLGEIECDKFPLATSYEDVTAAMESLYKEQHSYQTVVIDSLDWLERIIWSKVCQKRSVRSIEDISYGKGYVCALTYWEEILAGLEALRNDRGLTVALIAHAKIERYDAPDTDSYDRHMPRLHKLASQLVQEWCDEVLFATYKVYTKQADEDYGRKKAKGVGSGERVLYTSERPAHIAKNRLGLPYEMPLNWGDYASFFNKINK
jgi:hypothetical protein